jgi:hypothetical protein
MGCTLEASLQSDAELGTGLEEQPLRPDIYQIARDPSVLCKEKLDAQPGDACTPFPFAVDAPCLPTRAVLNADGTVASHAYLRCDPTTSKCVPAPAPVIPKYLQPCAFNSSAGTPGTSQIVSFGVFYPVETCLLAWDAATQTFKRGITERCVGDWSCPAGTLCDDQLGVAGCKPGPRGVLTHAMLTP